MAQNIEKNNAVFINKIFKYYIHLEVIIAVQQEGQISLNGNV